MLCVGKTDIGKMRKNNQDCFRIINSKNYISAVVCDGMGGAKGGSVASSIAVSSYTKSIRAALSGVDFSRLTGSELEKIAVQALSKANHDVYDRSSSDSAVEGMGTTLVSFLRAGDVTVCLNVGDSRLYALREGELVQITRDHSFVQYLIDTGSISEQEAMNHPNRNIIMRAIGTHEHIDCDVFFPDTYDSLLLCTDGLTNLVMPAEIVQILLRNLSPETKIEQLIDLANSRGGSDNITAVMFCATHPVKEPERIAKHE